MGKQLGLPKEAVPGITRVALLLYGLDSFNARRIPPVEMAAQTLGVHLHLVYVETPQDFEAAFATMRRQGVDGLLVSFTPFLATYRAQIADLAAKSRLPVIDINKRFVELGGLAAESYPQRYQARRLAGGAAHDVRAGHQPQDRRHPRPQHPANTPIPGDRRHSLNYTAEWPQSESCFADEIGLLAICATGGEVCNADD
jgi:ABC-type uncharacterized transport system substrate-binding protein